MSNPLDFDMFLGAAGCLYVQRNICPPFHLRSFAEAWRLDGISLAHCLEQIRSHLAENSSQYRSGSGDGGLRWLDKLIRQSWDRLHRPPRAQPAATDRLYRRIANDAADSSNKRLVDRADKSPRKEAPIGTNQIDRAVTFLRRELADGEVEAVVLETNAKASGIALRTLDRARARLKVISRRTGFAKNGKSWLSLPTAPSSA
jgi:hypothetical protein